MELPKGPRKSRISPRLWFWISLALLEPLFCVSVYRSEWFRSPPKPIGDGTDYENIAFHLTRGAGLLLDYADPEWQAPYRLDTHDYRLPLTSTQQVVASGRPPLFPLLIGAVYMTIGRSDLGFAAVRIMLASALAIAGASSVYLTAKILMPMEGWEHVLGSVATLCFVATHRTLREYATDFLTEPIALLLMQCLVLVALRMCRKSRLEGHLGGLGPSAAVAGVIMGGLILTRSLLVVWLPGVTLLMLLSYPGQWRTRWQFSLLFCVTACLICLPWWIRNTLVLERLMPLGTQGPITLLGGYSNAALHSNGDWQAQPGIELQTKLAATDGYQQLENDTQRELMLADEAGREVRRWIRLHWKNLPSLMARRVYTHWNPYSGRSALWKVAIIMGVAALMVHRQRALWWLVGLLLISTGVTAVLYSTGGRFLVPLYGVQYTLAGVGVAAGTRAITSGLQRLRGLSCISC